MPCAERCDIRAMARPAPGHDVDGIEPQSEVGSPWIAREPMRGRARDTRQFMPVNSGFRLRPIGARFYFDEGDDAAPPRDDVDLALMRAVVPRFDPVESHQER